LKQLLRDLVHIRTGVFAKTNIEGDMTCLQVSDFDDEGKHKGIWSLSVSQQDVDPKHILNKGDVIFAAKGSKNFAAMRSSDLPLAVASTSFFVLRITNDELLPEFLTWYLNQPEILSSLKAEAKGTGIPSISKTSLGDIEIPILPIDKQKLLLKIHSCRLKQKKIMHKIMSLKDELIQQQIQKSLND
jgi:restriction endonuclease S subunit